MTESGATAVTFTLLSWVLAGYLALELWPELRTGRLRLRLRRLQLEQSDQELFQLLDAAARGADEFRWLPLLLAEPREPAAPGQERAAAMILCHAAWGAPWMWLFAGTAAGRRKWMRRAWGLACRLAEGENEDSPPGRP